MAKKIPMPAPLFKGWKLGLCKVCGHPTGKNANGDPKLICCNAHLKIWQSHCTAFKRKYSEANGCYVYGGIVRG